jgi:glyoxylase-like metal-dependent hydrolase (beta-lactamase superfamily II)
MPAGVEIKCIISSPFEENTYVVWKSASHLALVIDPGLEPELILDLLGENNLSVAAILNTHGHADHIAGNQVLKSAYPSAPLVIGKNEAPLLSDSFANLSAPFGMPVTSPPADRLVSEGDSIEYGGINLSVMEIPGHSPGHVVYLYRDKPIVVFGGDVLFSGSIGRSDFPNSDGALLIEGIERKLFGLPDDTIVYPGHGPETTVGHEKLSNPFVGKHAPRFA